ncbi:uncharacterized protein TRAVEDRAFT_43779 [Trametes versicolor FP-101664 SS1]|uniref:uncharacterized protein n=1 Tax=Trametes versicolor (strain FP-101664) TaxID=717944 RepID=UPI0004622E20|nr:uncharacterized protein TRAVEDRAFT_43779 [Trametes versicolor FP-101664 SS1]EIW63488.1 hypothetical protein TRAVEDRAFT_43779 [Trametes versicolor FP-101664 SS1]
MQPPNKKAKTADEASHQLVGDEAVADVVDTANAISMLARHNSIENAPLDILFEVFLMLRPRDLLSLARTSKAFRAFLMSRKSSRIWKETRDRHSKGAPKCPYAVLLFTYDCTKCGAPHIGTTYWALYRRPCSDCSKKEIVSGAPIDNLMQEVNEETGYPGGFLTYAIERGRYRTTFYYSRPEAVKFKSQWKRCERAGEKKRLVEERIASVKERKQEVKAITAWGDDEDRRRSSDLAIIREKRKRAIFARLRAEGWGDELDKQRTQIDPFGRDPLWKLYDCPGFYLNMPLTENDWDGMRDTLVAELDVLKTERLRTERRQATTERLKFLHGVVAAYEKSLGLRRSAASDLRAEFGDLAMMPAFRSIVELPACEPVTEQDFANRIDTIPALQAEWLRERQCEFEAIVGENAGGRLLQYPMVALAISCGKRLYCKICSVPSIGYMQVYDWKNASSHQRPLCDVRDGRFGPSDSVKANKWGILDAEHTRAVIAMDAALQAAGDIPGGAIFACTRCPQRGRGSESLVAHCMDAHDTDRPVIGEDFYLHPKTGTQTYPISIYPENARGDRTAAKDVQRGHAFFSITLFH